MTVRVIVDAHNAASISRIFYTPGSVTNNRKRAASACHLSTTHSCPQQEHRGRKDSSLTTGLRFVGVVSEPQVIENQHLGFDETTDDVVEVTAGGLGSLDFFEQEVDR